MFKYIMAICCFISTVSLQASQDYIQSKPDLIGSYRPQYIVMIFSSQYCSACQKLKLEFAKPNVQAVLRQYYGPEVYLVDVQKKEYEPYVKSYLGKTYVIPQMFILQRTSNSQGLLVESAHQTGYLTDKELEMFLTNPSRYYSKQYK